MEQKYIELSEMALDGISLSFSESFFVQFYRAFIENDRWMLYLEGMGTTLMVTALALIMGAFLGIIVSIIRTAHDQQDIGRHNPLLGFFNAICKVYVTVIRGTPMLVQLILMSGVIMASSRDFVTIGTITLGINSGAYVAEIFRGGMMSVDSGQMEAGRSLGLSYFSTMRLIIIPQGFKNALPSLGNEFIILLKDTSLVSIIGGKEVVYAAQGIVTRTYQVLFPYVGMAILYLVVVLIFTWLVGKLERRLRQSER